jgi:tripartite-type tricarboxylate transporter receptor subunit TctC
MPKRQRAPSYFRVVMIALAFSSGAASSQEYPAKPIRIYANEPGGVFDFLARVYARGLSGPLGQPVIVDNRPGNVIPAEIVSKSNPDGYSLLSHGTALAFNALLRKAPYDPISDFRAVSWTATAPLVVTVHPSVPVKSIRELIVLAKTRPGDLTYASTAIGGTPHLAAELFKSMAKVDIRHIPYKGAGAAVINVLSGEVQLIFSVSSGVVGHMKSGKLRALAVTSKAPSILLPGLPTVAASGLPGYESVGVYGVFAPARTPDIVVRRLSQELGKVVNDKEGKERLLASGVEPVGSSPEQFASMFKSEMVRMDKVIKDAGIRLE